MSHRHSATKESAPSGAAGGLEAFRDPASVAVVGASDDPAKWGYWLAGGALGGSDRRDVWLVNRAADEIQGHPAHRGLASLPGVPELLVVCVPGPAVPAVIDEALAMGTRAFLIITAGVPDAESIRARVTDAGGRIVGPNSLGLFDAATALHLAWGNFTEGTLAIISQSGQLGSEIAGLAARAGLGVSRFVSVGNQLDVNAAELLEDLVDHEQTRLVALYLESFADGEHLVDIVRRLRAAGKQTVILTTGASAGSQRLAASHTGSMTSALDIVDAACRAAGAVRVSTPTELVELARYLTVAPLPVGPRVAVVSDSGGQGGIAADAIAHCGLDTPVFSPELQTRLAELLPAGASVANPIDLAGAGEADMSTYARLCEHLAASGEVDAIVVSGYLGCYGEDSPTLFERELGVVDQLGELVDGTRVPLVVHSMSAGSVAVGRMWEHHIPTFGAVEDGVRALAHAWRLARHPGRALMRSQVSGTEQGRDEVAPGYWAARGALEGIGVPMPRAAVVTGIDDLARISAELKAPFVLKAGWLAHKSEVGGVVLGLRTPDELRSAYADMSARLGTDGEYVVEEMDQRADTVEMLIGARRDRDFGPTISIGAGGTEAELWRDVRTELAPVDFEVARSMIASLRSSALLAGWRGKPAADVDALARTVVAVADALCADRHIAEIEINPVRVGTDGPLAVDALMTSEEAHS